MTSLKVGDRILFDHFGGKDRPGRVVKVTATAVYIEWKAPSSGKTRVVPVRHVPYPETYSGYSQLEIKNVRRNHQEGQTNA
jgi:hypothetical protein